MIEVLHPSQGVIPISTILYEVNIILGEIGANNAHATSNIIYEQIEGLAKEISYIKGATSETIMTNKDGSFTINEIGHDEAMSVSVGFGFATANATAQSSGAHTALAIAETAAAAVGHRADSVAVAYGDNVTATTTVG